MKILLQFSKWFTGLLFIVSGLVKLNDPVGTQIKFEEYFEVFAADFGSFFHVFVPIALPMALIFCVLEVVLGIALLLQYRMSITAPALLGLIVFFTFLTFYSAAFNKVTDCGCFGDAIKFSPWGSFSKDVVLLVLILFIFVRRQQLRPLLAPTVGHAVVLACTGLLTFTGIYAIQHLPFIDFRPYKVGDSIVENRKLPPNAKPDVFHIEYTIKNKKTGETVTLDDKAYMQREDLWTEEHEIVHTEGPTLVQAGDKPKITDFSVRTEEGEDITEQFLTGTRLVVVVQDARTAAQAHLPAINALVAGLTGTQVKPVALTSSTRQVFEDFRHQVQLAIPYHYTDATVLKTIIRSNPGVWLLNDGVVLGKWHHNDVPDAATVKALLP